MWKWYGSLLSAWKRPQALGDAELVRTINQLRTCRGHLVMLMEEARLARQMLDVVDKEIDAERQRTKQEQSNRKPVQFNESTRQRGVV